MNSLFFPDFQKTFRHIHLPTPSSSHGYTVHLHKHSDFKEKLFSSSLPIRRTESKIAKLIDNMELVASVA